MNRREIFVLAAVALLLLSPAGFVIGQTLTHSASSGVTYQTNSGLVIELTDARDVEAVPFDNDQTFADHNLSVSGAGGNISVGDGAYGGDVITVTNVDATAPITVERSDLNRQFTVESGDATTLQVRDYSPTNDTEDIAYASTNGLTVELADLQADVWVAATDADTGDVLDTYVVDSDGTASFDLPSGTRSVQLDTVPAKLEVRNELKPDELITENVSLRARFFASDQVFERNVTNGTVDLDGLPPDEEVVVTVKESNANYSYRRILLDSIVQTSEIYLLPDDEPSAQVRFQLNDQTGRFEPDSTKLFIQKPITRNNSTEYRTISGDFIGADGEFPTVLVDSERYRVVVENEAGEKRVLGAYTVQGADIARLTIGEVQFSADVESGAVMQTSLREAADSASHDHEARIVYLDPEGETDAITISVTDGDGNDLRPTTTEQLNGSENVYVETYPLNTSWNPEEDTATVKIEAARDGGTETFEQYLGDVPDIFQGAPIDPFVLELIGLVSIIALVGLLVIVNPSMAALVGTGYAGLLSLLGVVPIPMPAVVLGGLVAILATVGTSRGVIQ